MAINLETDDLVPVGQLIKKRLGKRKSPATIWRWRLSGINGARLECVKAGGVWMCTIAAFAEFLRAQTANCTPAPIDAAPTERSEATRKKLAAAGLLAVTAPPENATAPMTQCRAARPRISDGASDEFYLDNATRRHPTVAGK